MAVYQLKISGVHYAANGDSVAGQKDTEEMHVRTRTIRGTGTLIHAKELYQLTCPS